MFPVKDTLPSKYPAVAVWILIAANAIVFYFELRLKEDDLSHVMYLFGLVPARFTQPRWAAGMGLPIDSYWPFLTSLFLHGGWLHIIVNMWTLWIFGDNVEDRMGAWRFLMFYLFCGVISLITHWYANPHSHVPAIGASGAIAGVLGAYLIMYPKARILTIVPIFFYPFFVEIPAYFYLGFWFLLQLASGAMMGQGDGAGGVAVWAHVGGFVAGMLMWPFFLNSQRRFRRVHADEIGIEDSWLRRQ